jgi:hypothetical protein
VTRGRRRGGAAIGAPAPTRAGKAGTISSGCVSSAMGGGVFAAASMSGSTGAPKRTRKLAVVVLSRAGSDGTLTV